MSAFSFMKTMVQTRAKAHTAIGTVCYRFGFEATSTLDTPVRQWPTQEETRAFDKAEKRRVAAAKSAGEKTRPRRLLPKLIRVDPPRHYDFRVRAGIVASGSALPEGGGESWCDPLEWARRVEVADGHRLDSRQCRDDVTGIPIELVRSGFADLAVARQAAKVAELRGTPVHWVIHKPHGAGLNWHAHLVYAGRRLTEDGEAFEVKRDTGQDKPELVEAHKALWVETCREFDVAISFEFPGKAFEAEVRGEFAEEHGREPSEEDERAVQIETRRRWKEHRQARASGHDLTPKAVRAERAAVADEEGERLDALIQGAGGAALSEQDRLELGRIASAVDELDTRELLALERVPVTTSGRLAKYGSTPEAPSPVPPRHVEPPRPNAAPVVAAAAVPAPAPSWPAPMPGAVAAHAAPSPRAETPVVPIRAIAGSTPVPSRQVVVLRPSPAPAIEAPLSPPRALSKPRPRAAARSVPPKPAPATPVPLLAPATLERMLPAPAPLHRVEPPRPMAGPVVATVVVPATALPRPAPMPGAVATRPTPSPRAETPVVPIRAIAEPTPVPSRQVVALRPNPAPVSEAPLSPPRALSRPQPLAAARAAPPWPAPAMEVPLAPPDTLKLMRSAPRPLHRVEPPRPEARAVPRIELGARLRRRAGFDAPLALVPERVLRPPRPAPRAEEALAPSPDRQWPAAAPEMIHPAPEPPWRRRMRRLLRSVRDWWPWASAPPSPDRRVEVRLPEQARPVPEAQRRLAAPQGLSRPRPSSKPILWQTPYGYDFDPVARAVTINAKGRAIEARVHAGASLQQPIVLPALPRTPQRHQGKSKGRGRDDGGIGN